MLNQYPDVLTVKQVSEILQLSEDSVYRILKDGEIGCRKIRRKYVIPKLAVIDYLQSARYNMPSRQQTDSGGQ
ncbi:MAG: helix-turn-helix domain-containing protein [Oscillospiraceae bacterium]|jgi:excisionase family DNA binding protein|nr:helix-turn-helix domain-containing protein [Oscillospiraceae bacterium]